MSKYWKFTDANTKIRQDLDLVNDDFVIESEMIEYFNDAIRECEAHIHDLGFEADYFLADQAMSLVNGEAEYSLPEDIYANKIRSLLYSEGIARIYEVRPYKRFGKFTNIAIDSVSPSTGYSFMYYLKNATPQTPASIFIVPTPIQNQTDVITVWYIRNANRIKNTGDIIDIPEHISFIFAHVKKSILIKRKEYTQDHKDEFEKAEQMMLATLKQQTDDNNDDISMDMSFYKDHS